MKRAIILGFATLCALQALAKIELGTPFSEGAVLQRGRSVPVWGKAAPGREVAVAFAGAHRSTRVGDDGVWMVDLPAMAASKESRTLTVSESEPGWFGSETDRVEVKDVLVGEVWFASGQSNMDCPMINREVRYRDGNAALVTEMTRLPCVRYVKNRHVWSVEPHPHAVTWRQMTPESFRTHGYFSAVAYYYARELYLALDVPIGIVDASWGGSNIDAWTPRSGYDDCDPSLSEVAGYQVKKDWVKGSDRRGAVFTAKDQPTVLFNGMVASWTPMAMRGFIWYQGCCNSAEPQLYCAKMHALYRGWVREFRNPDLKLYFVQLAPFGQNWNDLVAAQDRFAAEEKNAEIAVTADVGNFDDIHPNQKEIVAKRLVVHALKRDYGFDIAEDRSPVVRSVSVSGDRLRVGFDHVSEWYVYAANRSREAAFDLAGADGIWKPAKIVNYRQEKDGRGNWVETDYVAEPEIALRADGVPAPIRVRYMGRARTSGTLYNQMNLPLGPFEKGVSDGGKREVGAR